MNGAPWTQAEDAALAAALAAPGYPTYAQIAPRLQRTRDAVEARAQKLGMGRGKCGRPVSPPMTPQQMEAVNAAHLADLRAAGYVRVGVRGRAP